MAAATSSARSAGSDPSVATKKLLIDAGMDLLPGTRSIKYQFLEKSGLILLKPGDT
ncbi:MAG: hypothetical protein HY852_25070 [Bradyrhizobium sp.]|uniref:hypothetical protein n=1 Tax=Bradyrhizobium sp. TaxID=376 RepID=UPI0025C0BCFD|nr:hypothetical protein [Bradyrhizobium sp.]MBI5265080.1 hypothetical protein [Bradyrhizobium sp.]